MKRSTIPEAIQTSKARPFLKWVGGKKQLLDELTARMPQTFENYFEPFVGGGAFFFYLQPRNAYLSDINEALINTYLVIRDHVDELIEDLRQHRYEKSYFYQIRQVDRTQEFQKWTNVQKASRLIFLNKSCFNGLYRVNSRGEFNVPFGRYKSPTILDESNLRACHDALQGIELRVCQFDAIETVIRETDFVYLDPPYIPLNSTSNFTSYSKDGFSTDQQLALRDFCQRLDERGVKFMLSNSSADLIYDLYAKFDIDHVYASRSINSQASKRGRIPEVIVRNFK